MQDIILYQSFIIGNLHYNIIKSTFIVSTNHDYSQLILIVRANNIIKTDTFNT